MSCTGRGYTHLFLAQLMHALLLAILQLLCLFMMFQQHAVGLFQLMLLLAKLLHGIY